MGPRIEVGETESHNILLFPNNLSGATVKQIWMMDLGRFLFGVGGESITVAQTTYAVLWFKGKELNFVIGLQLSIGSSVRFWHLRASDVVIVMLLPWITEHD